MNALIFIQIVVSILLVCIILLQKSASDGFGGMGSGNTGLINVKTMNNFLIKLTIILATIFMLNAIILANLSNKTKATNNILLDKQDIKSKNIEETNKLSEQTNIPLEQSKQTDNQLDSTRVQLLEKKTENTEVKSDKTDIKDPELETNKEKSKPNMVKIAPSKKEVSKKLPQK